MKISLNDSAYSAKFENVIYSHDRYIVAYGGRGSGKTDSFYLKYLLELFQPYYFKLAYINKEKLNIRDQQYAGFKRVAKRVGLFDKLKFYDGDYRIVNEANGNALIPKGMDDPEKTKGMDEITAIWWDEINKGTLEDFLTLNSLLRSPQAKYLQFAISFNPVSESHWLRKEFFEEKDGYKLNVNYRFETLLSHSTYKDNEFINQSEYLKTLEKGALGDTNRLLVDVKGLWGVVSIKNPFFYALRKNIHFTDERYSLPDNTQLYLSFDFNKSPSTLVIGMIYQKEIAIIDLIICDENSVQGKSPLEACCFKFKEKYLSSGLITRPYLIITGDASGAAGGSDKVKNENFYTKIESILGIGKSQRKIRKKNIEHTLSQEICNSLIYNCNFKIYKSAELVLFDMEQAQIENGKLVKGDRDKGKGLDITDAVRYFMDCVLNFEQWQNYLRYYNRI